MKTSQDTMKLHIQFIISLFFVILLAIPQIVSAQYPRPENNLDKQVLRFLQEQAGDWRDMNVPASDGRILYELVLQKKYTKALEIGTSTGHSAIWIAWALSKTGGKLVTIEIDKKRYSQAMGNFRKAGLSDFIDARLGDAHEIVPNLTEKFDFVFCDADKWWYKNYFVALEPKIIKGGCFVAHNTNMRSSDIREFLDYIAANQNFATSIDKKSRSGVSMSFKK